MRVFTSLFASTRFHQDRLARAFHIAFFLSISTSTLVFADEPEAVPTVQGRVVLGYVEHILIGEGVEIEALLSASHHHSDLGVKDLSLTEDDKGKRIATFQLRGKKGTTQTFSLPVLDKKESSKSKTEVIVRIPICLGGYELTPQFRLTDRSKFAQPIRLGRKLLSGRVVIDPSMTHAVVPSCKNIKPKIKKMKARKKEALVLEEIKNSEVKQSDKKTAKKTISE